MKKKEKNTSYRFCEDVFNTASMGSESKFDIVFSSDCHYQSLSIFVLFLKVVKTLRVLFFFCYFYLCMHVCVYNCLHQTLFNSEAQRH